MTDNSGKDEAILRDIGDLINEHMESLGPHGSIAMHGLLELAQFRVMSYVGRRMKQSAVTSHENKCANSARAATRKALHGVYEQLDALLVTQESRSMFVKVASELGWGKEFRAGSLNIVPEGLKKQRKG